MKYLGVYYWYVKMARCRCVMHGLEYIMFYVQKHITRLAACSVPPADLRQATWGARICETLISIETELLLLLFKPSQVTMIMYFRHIFHWDVLFQMSDFSFKKMYWNISSANCQPF